MYQAQPPLEFIPPNFNPWVRHLAQIALPFLERSQASLHHVQGQNIEQLVDLYHQFQSGKIRLLIAFRHPTVYDPFCLGHLIWKLLPQTAKQQGVALRSPLHFHFIYDRGIPLWAGPTVAWSFPRLGGTPIQRGKLDLVGLKSARHLFANGQFPLAAAPEGGTNGHNEIVSPLEPGVAQMGFWCVEDLQQAGRSEQVLIVPLGIQYRYLDTPWEAVAAAIGQMEAAIGLPSESLPTNAPLEKTLYPRLYQLGCHLVVLMERYYQQFYDRTLPTNLPVPQSNEELADRLSALLNTALTVAEEFFHLQPKGSPIDRCRRIEQAGWDRIYREECRQPETLSPLERGLADRIAEEASLRMWHMRLVEDFVAVTGKYVREKPSLGRFADTTLLLGRVVKRIQGDTTASLPHLGKQKAYLTVGTPLCVTERWDAYRSSRRGAKQAVADLTQELQVALEQLIRSEDDL
jgi:hypothetical protein